MLWSMRRASLLVFVLLGSACAEPSVDPGAAGSASRGVARIAVSESEAATAVLVPGAGTLAAVEAGEVEGVRFVLDPAQTLWRVEDDRRVRVLDGALSLPTGHLGGLLLTRAGSEPGRADIWRLSAGQPAERLVQDAERPLSLGARGLLFVSARTSVASIWWRDAQGEEVQLTNRGLVAGALGAGFVPPPLTWLASDERGATWDAGSDGRWRVDLATGEARRLSP